MKELWHEISYRGGKTVSGGAVEAEARIEAASLWFSGHFPGEPILPGIAILAMVTDVVRRYAAEQEKEIRISGIKRVRFRAPVRPGESLGISVNIPDQCSGGSCPFRVILKGDAICTGVVDVAPSVTPNT